MKPAICELNKDEIPNKITLIITVPTNPEMTNLGKSKDFSILRDIAIISGPRTAGNVFNLKASKKEIILFNLST